MKLRLLRDYELCTFQVFQTFQNKRVTEENIAFF